MATSRSVFLQRSSLSRDLGRLVQGELSRVDRTISGHATLSDLRAMIETLSTLASTCASVLEDISAGEKDIDPSTALKEMENVLQWNECSSIVSFVTALQRLG